MGDRANILVKKGEEQVCLYTHWAGSELPETLQKALQRGEQRWNDFQYLTRIIFCEMIARDELEGLTGYGITQVPHDGSDRVIQVNVDAQTVQTPRKDAVSFADFIKREATWGNEWTD